ncbi:MAG TPA: MaoC/PaaZ C-terminal domain-containing protein, partial [Chthoniobacterales bacterium]|nr:MaoC/PaaZ C-terminal domain-containing protein [Chthoniobacterales bacterium]
MNEIHFEDLKVGARFVSEPYEVTEAAIIRFAQEFDVQAFHLDSAAAKTSVFGGLAASGWHTAAIAMRLFTTTMHFAGGAVGLAVDELRWPVAVRPNDTLQLETKILE